jgi:hypothetical protein
MSTQVESRKIDLQGPFNRIKISGPGKFAATRGSPASLVIAGDRRILDKIAVKVVRDTLHLQLERDVYDLNRILFEPGYEIVAEEMISLDVSGELVGTLAGPRDNLRLALSGLANVTAEDVAIARLDAEFSGSTRFRAAGAVGEIMFDASGSSQIGAENLKAARGRVSVRGSAVARVFVSQHLLADASGVGRVIYRGRPHLVKSESGLGRVVADN